MRPAVAREWEGETAFIIAGGPSVLGQPLELLAGRRVIAVNSSYQTAPGADVLFFGDDRWWSDHSGKPELQSFRGRIVTVAQRANDPRIVRLKAHPPPGLSDDPSTLTFRRTSLTAAINLALHLGVTEIVLLGADGKAADDGRTHHHAPHRWLQRPNCWDEQKKDLVTIVTPLRRRGITVINASPGSAWADLWPVKSLRDAIGELEAALQHARDAGDRGQPVPACGAA